jgi:tetratricopeptide (TPR) repeat protein
VGQALIRYDEAIEAFDTALQNGMERGVFPLEQAWLNKGVTLTRLRRYDEAIAAYTKALQLNPYFTQAQQERDNLSRWMQGL